MTEQEKNNLQKFFDEIKDIAEKYEEKQNEQHLKGENFNIFSILEMESDEEKTHSNFLAELLNPGGRHGQGAIFLKKFIAILDEKYFYIENEKQKWNLKNFNCENASVRKEAHGRLIDILIESENKKIAIENKIYAGEQPEQLKRYGEFLKQECPKEEDRALLFLTLEGRKSDNHENFKEYYRISYKDDILKWLEECKKVANSHVRRGITDYINLIKKLTHQTIDKEMNEEITNLVEKNLKAYKTIIDNQYEIQRRLVVTYLFKRIKEVRKESFKDLSLLPEEKWYKLKYSYKKYTIIFESSNVFYYGFCEDQPNHEKLKEKLKGKDYKMDPPWAGSKNLNFNVGRILKVKNNPEYFKKEIREIFTELIAAADEVEKEL